VKAVAEIENRGKFVVFAHSGEAPDDVALIGVRNKKPVCQVDMLTV
jgi:hypothetical protein